MKTRTARERDRARVVRPRRGHAPFSVMCEGGGVYVCHASTSPVGLEIVFPGSQCVSHRECATAVRCRTQGPPDGISARAIGSALDADRIPAEKEERRCGRVASRSAPDPILILKGDPFRKTIVLIDFLGDGFRNGWVHSPPQVGPFSAAGGSTPDSPSVAWASRRARLRLRACTFRSPARDQRLVCIRE